MPGVPAPEPRETDNADAAPLREVDAADLATADLPVELPSLPLLSQAGYVIEGWSHLVAGYPKAGKTELVYACVREWVRAGRSVLWLTEESELVWGYRLRRDPTLPRGLRLVFGLGERPDRLLDRAMRGDEPVVVIDTIRSLLGIADEADNAEIARVVGQWESALRGKTRLYVHHLRKGLGDHGLAVAGGTMLVGAVDRVLELRHDEHDSGRRVLRVLSRIVGAPDLLLGLDSDGWPVALGDPAAVELKRVMAACLGVLESETWLKTGEVRDRLPKPTPSHNQVLKALRELWQQGAIERDPPEDRQRATYRWRLSPGSPAGLHFTRMRNDRVKEEDAGKANLPSHQGPPCEGRCPTPDLNFTSHGPPIYVGSEDGSPRCRCGGLLEPSDYPDWLRCDRCRNYVRASDPALVRPEVAS